jgi:predicted nucleotidyltransferase
MAEPLIPDDFREFLRLLNDHGVEYLLIGGYAVAYYGYPRTTAGIDIWVAMSRDNASALVEVFHRFGMSDPSLTVELFLKPDQVVRMGVPPMRVEVLTSIDGVEFADCYAASRHVEIDGVAVRIISLPDLKANKRASGRHKDLDDLEHLP